MSPRDDIRARLKRLRQAGRARRSPANPTPPAPSPTAPTSSSCLTQLPGTREVVRPQGSYLLRETRYPLHHRQGKFTLQEVLGLPREALTLVIEHTSFDLRRAIFLDTETSGLGGAGAIVFLTGIGFFEKKAFVVQQYFARHPGEERAYLPDLAQKLARAPGLITFNGRSFDWPLLRSRFVIHGMRPPPEPPHLDLLPPARRLWRSRLGACNFGHLEQHILAYQRPGPDVPSWLIPTLWIQFVQGQGQVETMERVLYHNQEDIVSMPPLTHALLATLTQRLDPHPHDWVALARVYQRAGRFVEAEDAYRQALEHPLPPAQRARAMRELAFLLKRLGRRQEAARWWRSLARLLPQDIEALVELAKYYEWHQKDIKKARAMTEEAIRRAEDWERSPARQQALAELEHRLARLRRKS